MCLTCTYLLWLTCYTRYSNTHHTSRNLICLHCVRWLFVDTEFKMALVNSVQQQFTFQTHAHSQRIFSHGLCLICPCKCVGGCFYCERTCIDSMRKIVRSFEIALFGHFWWSRNLALRKLHPLDYLNANSNLYAPENCSLVYLSRFQLFGHSFSKWSVMFLFQCAFYTYTTYHCIHSDWYSLDKSDGITKHFRLSHEYSGSVANEKTIEFLNLSQGKWFTWQWLEICNSTRIKEFVLYSMNTCVSANYTIRGDLACGEGRGEIVQ